MLAISHRNILLSEFNPFKLLSGTSDRHFVSEICLEDEYDAKKFPKYLVDLQKKDPLAYDAFRAFSCLLCRLSD